VKWIDNQRLIPNQLKRTQGTASADGDNANADADDANADADNANADADDANADADNADTHIETDNVNTSQLCER
jgi:hypothetical protein